MIRGIYMFNIFNMFLAGEETATKSNEWYDIIGNVIDNIIGPILIIFCSIGIIYAVVIGVKMMKAEDKTAREENKARLINLAISIVAVIALIALFYGLRGWLTKSGTDNIKKITTDNETTTTIGQALRIMFRR